MGPPTPRPTGPKLGGRLIEKPPIPHYGIQFHNVKRMPSTHTGTLLVMGTESTARHITTLTVWVLDSSRTVVYWRVEPVK